MVTEEMVMEEEMMVMEEEEGELNRKALLHNREGETTQDH